MSFNKLSSKIVRHTAQLAKKQSIFVAGAREFARPLGQEISPPLFPEAVRQTNKLAFAASSAAICMAGFVIAYNTNEDFSDEVGLQFGRFMASYGNRAFLELMTYETCRETVYNLRAAELLYYGIGFEDNSENAVFYRGMYLPPHIDEKDDEAIKKWQDETIKSMVGRGFSPLLWLARPSATKARGFNTIPHDGNRVRAHAAEAPPSWSAGVMAMTCSFNILKGYSTLFSTSEHDRAGCVVLCAPKKITYLSSTDIRGMHKENIGHEFEVISPHIDSEDTLAILFVEYGKISRVEINPAIYSGKYTIDMNLIGELKKALSSAAPEVQEQLGEFVTFLENKSACIDLAAEFDKRFHDSLDELIEYTKEINAKCDDEIQKMPAGIIKTALLSSPRQHEVRARADLVESLGGEEEVARIESLSKDSAPTMQK